MKSTLVVQAALRYVLQKEYTGEDAIAAITSKNLFFTIKGMDSAKIPLSEIVSIYPYSNGVLVVQDGKRKSPLFFHVDDDSWFLANALKNASNIS